MLQVTSVPGRSNSPGVSTETNIHPTTALFRVTHFGCKNEYDRHDPNLNDHQHGQDLGKQQQQQQQQQRSTSLGLDCFCFPVDFKLWGKNVGFQVFHRNLSVEVIFFLEMMVAQKTVGFLRAETKS